VHDVRFLIDSDAIPADTARLPALPHANLQILKFVGQLGVSLGSRANAY
jgi:hypothetical protein